MKKVVILFIIGLVLLLSGIIISIFNPTIGSVLGIIGGLILGSSVYFIPFTHSKMRQVNSTRLPLFLITQLT